MFENLDAGEIQQGGSTITQQLVKNTMGDPTKRDLKTKLREAVLARRLENEMTKDEILERYLNIIYLGNGAYGVQAATERYFGKRSPMELTLGEAALLAGLIQAPESLNPITHPDRAARRRTAVLDAMIDTGKLTPQEARVAREELLPLTAVSPDRNRDRFTQHVVDLLTPDDANPLDPERSRRPRSDANEADRYNALFKGGLKIYTSYDPALQFLAGAAVDAEAAEVAFVAAMVVIDNATGGVRAMYAARPFAETRVQPGDPGRPPDRLDVQGDRARDRARSGLLAQRQRQRRLAQLAAAAWFGPGHVESVELPRRARSASRTRSRTPTTARSPARCSRSGRATTASDGAERLRRHGRPARHRHARRSARTRRWRSAPANTNVLDMAEAFSVVRQRRRPP